MTSLIQPYTHETVGTLWTSLSATEIAPQSSLLITCLAVDTGAVVVSAHLEPQSSILRGKKTVWTFDFPLDRLPMSQRSALRCSWGDELAEVEVSRFPHKGNVVKVNTLTRSLLVDDSPYLPMGFYLEWKRWQTGGENFTVAMFEEVANGFNTPLPYRSGTPQELIDYGYLQFLDNMAKMEMKVHFNMYGTGMSEPSAQKTKEIEDYVALLKDHPALLGYYIADEPDGQGIDPLWIKDTYDLLKALDPYHPVTLVLNCMENPQYVTEDYIHYAEIIMSDPYPIGLRNEVGCDTCEGSVFDVAKRAEKYMADLNGRKPFWMIPQAFGGEQHWDRQPNARELRVMTYLSVIGGATGIQHFVLGALLPEYNQGTHWEPKSRMWAEARAVAMELLQLAPPLFSLDSPPPFALVSEGLELKVCFEQEKGVITVIVANPENVPKGVEFDLELPVDFHGTGEVAFEQRAISFSGPTIRDQIDAYGTRVYRFYSLDHLHGLQTLREGNMILNPSFEIQHHTGFPDSFLIRFGNGGSVLSDPTQAVSGYSSIRLVHPGTIRHDGSSANQENDSLLVAGVDSFLGTKIVGNVTYVASLYAKGKVDGLQVSVTTCFGTLNTTVATTWKEIRIVGSTTESVLCSLSFSLLEEGTVWIDSFSVRERKVG